MDVIILDVTNSLDISFVDEFVDLVNLILRQSDVGSLDRFFNTFRTSLSEKENVSTSETDNRALKRWEEKLTDPGRGMMMSDW